MKHLLLILVLLSLPITVFAAGDSMYPIIRGRDLLIIEAVKEPLRVGDVPLYKRDSGQYVLRRLSQKVFTGGALDEYEQNDLDYLIASGSGGRRRRRVQFMRLLDSGYCPEEIEATAEGNKS